MPRRFPTVAAGGTGVGYAPPARCDGVAHVCKGCAMVLLDTYGYRLEHCGNTPKPYALDRKERGKDGRVCLVNVGWFDFYHLATAAMCRDVLARVGRT